MKEAALWVAAFVVFVFLLALFIGIGIFGALGMADMIGEPYTVAHYFLGAYIGSDALCWLAKKLGGER